jgi:hypothetical protein
LIKTVRSKKGFPFHSIILSLKVVRSESVQYGVKKKTAYFKLLIFFVSFPGSFLEVSILTFLEFNIPLECYDGPSESIQFSVSSRRTLDLVIK